MPRKRKASNGMRSQIDDLIGGGSRSTPTRKQAKKHESAKAVKSIVKRAKEQIEELVVVAPKDQQGFMLRGKFIPKYPEELSDLELGYKTPAVREWYAANHPDLVDHIYPTRNA